ncbi:carbohydrate esterase family 16 protein [Sphaerobolus stellatus SS14]|uniref:Carbohydrate esterase family 16 protein n=1 Tax=Sphaerobolus stellatus (strain SS14) TaxID=990650 RepID=A0A0C9V0Z7_SPHS4|nr:carbohydrate esterase family 16 protein [Sphaerobolus stellatus SS14]
MFYALFASFRSFFTLINVFWTSHALLSLTCFGCGAVLTNRLGQTLIRHSFGRVVVFGDSASDNGTGAWTISNHTWPEDPAYFGHRFTNGPAWVEHLAQKLEAELIDNAIGGSTSNNSFVQGYTGRDSKIPVPSALDQLDTHLKSYHVSSDDLHIIMTGGNDVFYATSVDSVIPTIRNMVTMLSEKGATKFLLASYPKLGELPFRHSSDMSQDVLNKLSLDIQTGLLSLRSSLCRQGGLQVGFVDIYRLFREMLERPVDYGFDPAIISKNCLAGAYGDAPRTLCMEPEKYIFWDEYHLTGSVHRYIGGLGWKASQSLCNNSLSRVNKSG